MKKLLLLMMLFVTLPIVADDNVSWFKAFEFAYKVKGYEWSDWSKCSINIKLDLDNDKVTIYSKEVQIYWVINEVEAPYDSNGQQVAFKVKDQDGDYGHLRLRVQSNGVKQIYIDFSDISWVYSLE